MGLSNCEDDLRFYKTPPALPSKREVLPAEAFVRVRPSFSVPDCTEVWLGGCKPAGEILGEIRGGSRKGDDISD